MLVEMFGSVSIWGSAEDPTRAEVSDLGSPTEPGNAGVPADVGGDDFVHYDSPSLHLQVSL